MCYRLVIRTVVDSIFTSSKTFSCWDLVMQKLLRHSLPSADSRRAGVSYWRKNAHWVLVNCLGCLPRNSLARLTDRAWNELKCVETPQNTNTNKETVNVAVWNHSQITKSTFKSGNSCIVWTWFLIQTQDRPPLVYMIFRDVTLPPRNRYFVMTFFNINVSLIFTEWRHCLLHTTAQILWVFKRFSRHFL